MQEYGHQFESEVAWPLKSFEKYPKFDKITEFMNIALLPLGIIVGLLMFGLAICATNITLVTCLYVFLSICLSVYRVNS